MSATGVRSRIFRSSASERCSTYQTSSSIRSDHHRAELQQLELRPSLADPALTVQDRAAVLELDGESGGAQHRAGGAQPERRGEDVEDASHRDARTTTVAAAEWPLAVTYSVY